MSNEERIKELEEDNKFLRETIFNAWAILVDYDGYYSETLKKGDPHGLASIIREATDILNSPRRRALDRIVQFDEEIGLYDDWICDQKDK
jgi:capsular polysaccharide biosynthesis protein